MKHQFSLELIERRIQHSVIQQRSSDGYINASALCSAAGRQWYHYRREETAGGFLRALGKNLSLTEAELTQTVQNSDNTTAVWVHPQVALHLAQWLSPEFAVQVTQWVQEWLTGGKARQPSGGLPYHIARHVANLNKVPPTHFSILQEMTFTLIGPLEMQGYTLPQKMVPDISQGKMFCKFAREELGLDTDALPVYNHEYPDGRVVEAKLYPIELLAQFRQFIHRTWMPERAAGYFKERDPQALPYLDKVLKIGFEQPKLPSRGKSRRAA